MPAHATISSLPHELLLRIFSGLHYRDLVSARRTCSRWREVGEDDLLWRGIVTRHLGPGSWLHDDTIPTRVEMALAVLLGMLTYSKKHQIYTWNLGPLKINIYIYFYV